MIQIYTSEITTRLSYALDFIFTDVLGTPYEVTTHTDKLQDSSLIINYSTEYIRADICITPVSLLFEKNIKDVSIELHFWKELPCFFHSGNSQVPFDIFAAAFYLLSRYEEYLPYKSDTYERFPHTQSIAYKHNFLHIPLIDKWILEFKNTLQQLKPSLNFKEASFNFIPTYDIDIAYSYKGKGILRNAGGFVKDLLFGKFIKTIERTKVLLGLQQDPFDSFDFLDALHKTYSLQPIYFILLGDGKGLDKNIDPSKSLMKELIAQLQANYTLGIHPSYKSHTSIETLKMEAALLDFPSLSRQHYIRFHLPETYRNLIQIGIKEEYSMGYGSINGFRAGTSNSFFWFDLPENKVTDLKVHPFCYMECNSRFEQHQNPDESVTEMLHYLKEVKSVKGNLITVWHNFSLGTDSEWKGWKEAYVEFIRQIRR